MSDETSFSDRCLPSATVPRVTPSSSGLSPGLPGNGKGIYERLDYLEAKLLNVPVHSGQSPSLSMNDKGEYMNGRLYRDQTPKY